MQGQRLSQEMPRTFLRLFDMKAPDKIYIAVYPNDDGLDTHLGDWYSEPEFHAEDNLEYINKDALLEKLEKAAASYKKRSDEGELVWQNMCGINEAIKILNSM
jgi:hypothetical protein